MVYMYLKKPEGLEVQVKEMSKKVLGLSFLIVVVFF